jgi:hypothetical protein
LADDHRRRVVYPAGERRRNVSVQYYIGRTYQGRLVILQIDAANQQFKVELANQLLKTIPIKGLYPPS